MATFAFAFGCESPTPLSDTAGEPGDTATETNGLSVGAIMFWDDFSTATLNHRTGYHTVTVDGQASQLWEANGGKWTTNTYVHGCNTTIGCELQYYTRYDLNYAVTGPENYPIPGHLTNYVTSSVDDSIKLTLRPQSPPAKGWIPGWMGNQSSPPMPWYADGGNYYAHFDYTSGYLESAPSFRYGYFEIRAKIPNEGRVAWPAFWLFGGTSYEPSGRSIRGETATEIDDFEFTGYTSNEYSRNEHAYFQYDYYVSHYGDPASDPTLVACPNPGCNYDIDFNSNSITIHSPFAQVLAGVDLGTYHTYGVEWAPRKITFYFDGQPISSSLTKNVPSNFMKIIANLALPQWLGHGINSGFPGSDLSFSPPPAMEIDYIRAYKLSNKDFVPEWHNGGSDRIDGFIANPDDRYLVGNFDGDSKKELLAINSNSGHANMMKYSVARKTAVSSSSWSYSTAKWSTPWGTGGDQINWFYLNSNDHYVAGNFIKETSGPAKDELFALSADSGHAHLMSFANGAWSTPWATSSGQVNWWIFHNDDQYVVGDFDGDGQSELLAINAGTKSAHLMKYVGNAWTTAWAATGGQINSWIFNADDKYVAADFDGNGRAELLAVNAGTKRAHLMRYNAGAWSTPWATSSGQIDWWYVNASDQYAAADFDGDGRAELLANSNASGHTHLMTFGATATSVSTKWTNEGLGQIHKPDFVMAGDFDANRSAELLFVSQKDWAFLSRYKVPGEMLSF